MADLRIRIPRNRRREQPEVAQEQLPVEERRQEEEPGEEAPRDEQGGQPDFEGPGYRNIRNMMMEGYGMTLEQAIGELHRAHLGEEPLDLPDPQEQRRPTPRSSQYGSAEEEQSETEHDNELSQATSPTLASEPPPSPKKKIKMNDFEQGRPVDDYIDPRPMQYALNKLETGDYIDLWYFTDEGIHEAQQLTTTTTEEGLGIEKTDETITLKSTTSTRPSKNAIPDQALTWHELSIAKILYLEYIKKADWPTKHVEAMAAFFVNLEVHPMRRKEHGERIIIEYQAKVRRLWHDKLKRNVGFDISIINNNLMREIYDDVWDRVRRNQLQSVSYNSFR